MGEWVKEEVGRRERIHGTSWLKVVKGNPALWLQVRRLVGTEAKKCWNPAIPCKGWSLWIPSKDHPGAREGLLLPLTHDNRCVLLRRCRFRRKMIF